MALNYYIFLGHGDCNAQETHSVHVDLYEAVQSDNDDSVTITSYLTFFWL